MPAAQKNLVIEQYASYEKKFVWRNKLKRAYNLTGYAAKMQVRLPEGGEIITLSTENGRIVLGGVAGSITLLLTPAETGPLNFTTASYDLKLIAPDGKHTRLLQGKITLSKGQTQ